MENGMGKFNQPERLLQFQSSGASLSLSWASGDGQDLQRYLVLDGVYVRPCYPAVFCLIPCYAIPSGHV